MTLLRWPGLAVAILVAGLLVLWLVWPRDEAATASVGTVRIAPAPVTAAPVAAPALERARAPARDWLIGTWSRRDNKGAADAPCDRASATTYLPNGQYFAWGASGRFALGVGEVSYWGRILYDIDAGEDRSHFEERSSVPVARIGAHAMQLGNALLYRCLKAASDRVS